MKISATHRDLFPTRIWFFDLTGLAAYHGVWEAELARLQAEHPSPAGRSNRKGWNSQKTIFAFPGFKPLQAACELAFRHAFQHMGLPQDFPMRLEAWANVHEQGAYNASHVHPNVLLSGCYYLAVPPGSGALMMRDPRPGAVLSPFGGKRVNNGQSVNIVPKLGQLVVFPNWMEHSVEMHEGTEPRVCIAMNALAA